MIDIYKILEYSSDSLSRKKHLKEFFEYHQKLKMWIDVESIKNIIIDNYITKAHSYKYQIVYLIIANRNNIDL